MKFFIQNLVKQSCRIFLDHIPFSRPVTSTIEDTMSEAKMTRKPRYDGRTKKRQWEDRRLDKGAELDPTMPKLVKIDGADAQAPVDKIKKRKFAFLMGYSGANYYGMQRNPNTRTIEEDLFKALFDAEFINQDCYTQVQNMQFQRAARTDKGVSAARQVVSLKLGENFELAKVNERLGDDIRVFSFKRVTKGFNSKSLCDGRTYVYILPTVSFVNRDDLQSQKGFRLSEETHKKVNEILQLYVGTKNFHNFTVKKRPNDPSAKRFIKSFECEAPFVTNDVEFCALKIYGQSFMMHQIRKMIGLVLAVMRGLTGKETIEKAISSTEKVNVPRAPGLGLLLDYVHYERYNHRYGTDGMHEKLTWEDVDNEVEEFKKNKILPTIINTEIEEEPMMQWLQKKLSRHSYDDVEEKDESDDEGAADDDADDQVTNTNKDEIKDLENKSEEEIDKVKASV